MGRFTASKQHLQTRTATVSTPKTPGKRFTYPERLLVYHAGTGRTVFLGCLKLTTIFICGFFTLVVLPRHVFAEKPVHWVTATIAISGLVPMVFVAYVSGPFVTYIHLRLPAFARSSKDMALRFARTLPKDTELDLTTMNFFGKPQVARLKLKDIYAARERFGMVNFVRDTTDINQKRKWWMGKAIRQFGVHGKDSGFLNGEVWNLVKKNIEKNKLI
ncbi:hypothetical protein K3495_g8161 [Podosphaera aphanis]|nr:hypothetical protein K3495_g8161 [Podosphaera aphanis]